MTRPRKDLSRVFILSAALLAAPGEPNEGVLLNEVFHSPTLYTIIGIEERLKD